MTEHRIGSNVRRLRKAAGLKQRDVAKALGVGQQTVSAWEGGQNSLRDSTILALANVLGVHPGAILEPDATDTPSV